MSFEEVEAQYDDDEDDDDELLLDPSLVGGRRPRRPRRPHRPRRRRPAAPAAGGARHGARARAAAAAAARPPRGARRRRRGREHLGRPRRRPGEAARPPRARPRRAAGRPRRTRRWSTGTPRCTPPAGRGTPPPSRGPPSARSHAVLQPRGRRADPCAWARSRSCAPGTTCGWTAPSCASWRRATRSPRRCCSCTAGACRPACYADGVSRLTAAGVRVVAPCLPGFGGSDPLPLHRAGLADYAHRIARLLEVLGEDGPVFVAGHSFGGGIALQLATERPDLVRSLTLVNPVGGGALPDSPDRVAGRGPPAPSASCRPRRSRARRRRCCAPSCRTCCGRRSRWRPRPCSP